MIHTTGKRILLLGQGPQAQACVAALAALPGVQSVRQQAVFTPGSVLPQADVCIELLEGLSMAYNASMQALAQGMGLVVGSAIVAATHGQLLAAAARGQGAYFACAAHGVGALPTMLQALQATALLWLPANAAQAVIGRMYGRLETVEVANRQLQMRGQNMDDLNGKQVHLRAHALLGAWQGVWPNPAQQTRTGLDALEPAMLPLLNQLELQLVYGCTMGAAGITTGPLVVPAGMTTGAAQTDGFYASTPAGEMVLSLPPAAGLQAAVLAAIQPYLAGQRREVKLATAPQNRQDTEAHKTWQLAVFQQTMLQRPMDLPIFAESRSGPWRAAVVANHEVLPVGVLTLPIAHGYRPPNPVRLRLVS